MFTPQYHFPRERGALEGHILTDEEIRLVADTGTSVVHCPE